MAKARRVTVRINHTKRRSDGGIWGEGTGRTITEEIRRMEYSEKTS